MTTTMTNANRRLQRGTLVVSTMDGEPGGVVRISTYRRNGVDAWSYLVATAYGNEIWDASECLAIETNG